MELSARGPTFEGVERFGLLGRRVQLGVEDVLVGESVEVTGGGELVKVQWAGRDEGFQLGFLVLVAWERVGLVGWKRVGRTKFGTVEAGLV